MIFNYLDPLPPTEHNLTCKACNRAFRLLHKASFCAGEHDRYIFATCVQKESTKDMVAVILFLSVTTGPLVWDGLRPWLME
jgi:hypothetical protein